MLQGARHTIGADPKQGFRQRGPHSAAGLQAVGSRDRVSRTNLAGSMWIHSVDSLSKGQLAWMAACRVVEEGVGGGCHLLHTRACRRRFCFMPSTLYKSAECCFCMVLDVLDSSA